MVSVHCPKSWAESVQCQHQGFMPGTQSVAGKERWPGRRCTPSTMPKLAVNLKLLGGFCQGLVGDPQRQSW